MILIERLGEDVRVLLLGTLLSPQKLEVEEEEEDIGDEADASMGMVVRRIVCGVIPYGNVLALQFGLIS